MKKIVQQLVKIYPNSYVNLEHCVKRYSPDEEITTNYRVYVSEEIGHTPEFPTLKELDAHLVKSVPNYKPVYK